MILLEVNNRIVEDTLKVKIGNALEGNKVRTTKIYNCNYTNPNHV